MTVKSLTCALLVVVGVGVAPPYAVQAAATLQVDSTADQADGLPGDGRRQSAAGDCTLRAAIMEANARSGRDTVSLPAGRFRLSIPVSTAGRVRDFVVADLIAQARGDLNVTEAITIRGAGARRTIIDGNGVDRVFKTDADAWMSDLTITGGDTGWRAGPSTSAG